MQRSGQLDIIESELALSMEKIRRVRRRLAYAKQLKTTAVLIENEALGIHNFEMHLLSVLGQKASVLGHAIGVQMRIVAITSDIEARGFFPLEKLPVAIQGMILECILTCPSRLVPARDRNLLWSNLSALLLSKEINLIAIPLLYEVNTILFKTTIESSGALCKPHHQSYITRLSIEGDICGAFMEALECFSKLTHLTLDTHHAPDRRRKRPFRKPGDLSHIVIANPRHADR